MADKTLEKLVALADRRTLEDLLLGLASHDKAVQRQVVERLGKGKGVPQGLKEEAQDVSRKLRQDARDAKVIALWDELEPDLAEMDELGGADYETMDNVGDLLGGLRKKLESSETSAECREALREEILQYIDYPNSGMEDALYEVAEAACKTDADWRSWAAALEELKQDWPFQQAMRIYRQIGAGEDFLRLRLRKVESGMDYHDLVTYHWENGRKEEALKLLQEGLRKGTGGMDGLRRFAAERAKESGERPTWLDMELATAVQCLTFESYKKFEGLCHAAEWPTYEPRLLAAMEKSRDTDKLKLFLHRQEHGRALEILLRMGYPNNRYDGSETLKLAERLEEKFPKELLAFYRKGMNQGVSSVARENYVHQAQAAARVRRVLVDIMKQPEEWRRLKNELKLANHKRPAFQEEFAKAIPDW